MNIVNKFWVWMGACEGHKFKDLTESTGQYELLEDGNTLIDGVLIKHVQQCSKCGTHVWNKPLGTVFVCSEASYTEQFKEWFKNLKQSVKDDFTGGLFY